MASEKIVVRNTLNGLITETAPEIMDNPYLSKHLVVVEDENPKPLNIASPSTAEEFKARRTRRVSKPEGTDLKTEDTDTTEEG